MDGFAPSDINGNYKRPNGLVLDETFHYDSNSESNLFLLVGEACPWCHRTLLLHKINNLSDKVKIIFLKPDIDRGRWVFQEKFYNKGSLEEIYRNSTNNMTLGLRETLPILISSQKDSFRILSNESSGILAFFSKISNERESKELSVNKSNESIINMIDKKINNGVYKCGFARSQKAYQIASKDLFDALIYIENKLEISKGPWLSGNQISILDIYLFPTLIRWELIYSKLFKCTEKEISEFKNILKWRLNFFNLKGVDETCFEKTWSEDYFKALFPLNPNQIVPIQDSLKNILRKNKTLIE